MRPGFLSLILGVLILRQTGASDLSQFAVSGLNDLEARVTVEKADLAQLEKINKDFGILYRLREVTIRYKDPDKFRVDNRLGVFVVNGPVRYIRVPQLGIRRRDDVGAELGKRHSLLDVGILTTTRLDQIRWKFLRSEVLRGRMLSVFEVGFGGDETTRYNLWMDPQKKHVARRQWLDGSGKLRATFDYLQPVEVLPGIWLPTRIEVRNGEGVLAGATVYSDLKANTNPPDSLFETEIK